MWIVGTSTSHNSGMQSEQAALSCGVKLLGLENDHQLNLATKLMIHGDTCSLSARPYDVMLN
jgi:hypothetical protein